MAGSAESGPSWGAKLFMLLHQRRLFPIGPPLSQPIGFYSVSVDPWIGVMAVGYAFGELYQKDMKLRQRWLLIIGGFVTCFSSSLEPSTVRRTAALERTTQRNIHGSVIHQYDEVSAVAGLFVDDDWAAILALALFEI